MSQSDPATRFGIPGLCKPQWTGWLSNQYVAIILFAAAGALQNAVANGFPAVIYRSLEIRFGLNSIQTGVLASCYEIADVIFSLFLIHIFQKYHKPLVVGVCLMLAGVGGIIFILPHYLVDPHDVKDGLLPCNPNVSAAICALGTVQNKVYALFYVGMLIVGAASVPMHAFVPVWIDENMKKKNVGLYQGIFVMMSVVGAAAAAVAGGRMLLTHTDFDRGFNSAANPLMNPLAPVWVGAWWPGILGAACALIVVAFLVTMIPRHLDNRFAKASAAAESDSKAPYWSTTKVLFSDPVWWLATLCVSCDSWVIQTIQAFGVRQMTINFRMGLADAATAGGSMYMAAAAIGSLLSAMVMRKFGGDSCKLSTLSTIALIACTIQLGSCFNFLLRKENTIIQSVNFSKTGSTFESSNTNDLIVSTVNNCQVDNWKATWAQPSKADWKLPVCGTKDPVLKNLGIGTDQFGPCNTGTFYPVCDMTTGVTYYSPCFGGCRLFNTVGALATKRPDGKFLYANSTCHCAKASGGTTDIMAGYCIDNPTNLPDADFAKKLKDWNLVGNDESWKFPLFISLSLVTVSGFYMAFIPYMNIWIRGVDFKHRSQSMAWSSILVRVIGGIPGPIAVGALLDKTCAVWEKKTCGEQGSCLVYSATSANTILIIIATTRLLNIIFNGLIIFIQRRRESSGSADITTPMGKVNDTFDQ